MAGHALRREGRQSSAASHRTLWRAQSRPAIPLHVTPHASSPPNHPTRSVRMQKPPRASRDMIAARAPIHGLPFAYGIPYVLPPRPSSQISPHTKRAAHILPSECAVRCHGRTRSAQRRSAVLHRASSHVMARPIAAFRSPCMTLCASSSPNRPARSVRMQKPPRASRDMIAARAPIHGLPFAYGIPHVLPPKAVQPNQPSYKTRRAHPALCERARRVAMAGRAPRGAFSSPYRASSRVIERHTAAPAFPLPPVLPSKAIQANQPDAKARRAHPTAGLRGALSWPDALREGRSAALTALHHAL